MKNRHVTLHSRIATESHHPDERTDRKQRLAVAFRIFAEFGYHEGGAGHITARDPELTDHFWVNPLNRPFALMRVSDLVLVNSAGRVVEGSAEINGAAFAIHGAIHDARPDCVAAAHSHTTYAKAWSILGRRIDPISLDACAFYQDHEVFDDFTGPVFATDEGKRIAAALGTSKAVFMRNHGALTVGGSVDEAVWWFIALERACQVQMLVESVGGAKPLDHETAQATHEQVGSPGVGKVCFYNYYQTVIETQPEVLT